MKRMMVMILYSLIGFAVIGIVSAGYNHYSAYEVLVMFAMWLLLIFWLELKIRKDKYTAGVSVIIVAAIISSLIGWAITSSCDYLVFRTKLYFKLKYGDELVLRGAPFWQGDTNGVYYIKGEPDYYFHANTRLFSVEGIEDGYLKAVAAIAIDDILEEIIRDVIPKEFKMSSESMSMKFHEEYDFSNADTMMASTSYYQMYLMIDRDLEHQKEEIIEKVCELIEPYFQDAQCTIYFAFVSDPEHCERYSDEFGNPENVLVSLND